MVRNRIEELLRDPSLEEPSLDYHEVRLPWRAFVVRREVAERLMEAILGFERPEWMRVETITGSVVFLRTADVIYVQEWTKAQRASERRFWKAIEEEENKEKATEQEEEKSKEKDTEAAAPAAAETRTGAGVPERPDAVRAALAKLATALWVAVMLIAWLLLLR
ncbi:MAG: hypothetical protein LJF06_06960 [Gemmatimonadetes bacterium]|nr:hypothetical protein [Gemmatimonadota bacterium]